MTNALTAIEDRHVPVLTVDDHPILGDTMRLLVAMTPNLRHVGHFLSGYGVVDTVVRDGVKLVVLDYEIPGTDTIGLLEKIVSTCPECRVIMLSAHARPDVVEACRRAGAVGYVLKTATPNEIIDALQRIAAGETVYVIDR